MRDRDPTMKFALAHELVDQLYELARRRNQSVSHLLRDMVKQTLQENGANDSHQASTPAYR